VKNPQYFCLCGGGVAIFSNHDQHLFKVVLLCNPKVTAIETDIESLKQIAIKSILRIGQYGLELPTEIMSKIAGDKYDAIWREASAQFYNKQFSHADYKETKELIEKQIENEIAEQKKHVE
jgi:hypothetical protein